MPAFGGPAARSKAENMSTRKGHRRYYLNDIPVNEALDKFLRALEEEGALVPTPGERVPLEQALGRVTAGPVWAAVSSPHYHAAAMDGVAVRAVDTVGATETSPVRLSVDMQAVWVDTGAPMPQGFDAVIMLENLHETDSSTVEIMASVAPWQHVRPLGEDIVAAELVLPEGHRIGPVDLGAMAAGGLSDVEVRSRPRVAVLPTGGELVQPGATLKPGDIIESNSLVLAAMVTEWGGLPSRSEALPDDPEALRAAVLAAVEDSDLVLVNAGSSAGSRDFTAPVVEELGRLLVHGVALRPGHPVVMGIVNGVPVMGIPGYPVSAVLTCDLLVRPLLERKLGATLPRREEVEATITRKVLSPMGEDEYLRVKLGKVGGRLVATPIQRGAGIIMSMVRADGLVVIPRFSEGVDAGSQVSVELLRSLREVENTIVAIGSHDLTLDLLASHLRRHYPHMTLSSSNVGSLGGLVALRRGEAHLAGSHLLDEETGEYNLSYVRRYLEGRPVVLVNLVERVQGLIVAPGNPKSIAALEDLVRGDVAFVNRQRGSGTRVLLEYKLAKLGIDPSSISGYDREEYTHLAVAAAVAGGTADAGLGILAAARAIGLDFIPLLKERYDLVVPREHHEADLLAPLLSVIHRQEFRCAVEALGGYDASTMGDVVAELP